MKKTVLLIISFVCALVFLSSCNKCNHQYTAECDPTCDICGEERVTDVQHSFDDVPLCETRTCKVCSFVDERNHEFVTLSVTEPTLLKKGRKEEQCTVCDKSVSSNIDMLKPEDIGMSAIYITDLKDGSTPIKSLVKYEGEITVKVEYVSNNDGVSDFECYSTVKVQGASSSGYEKKNYTIKLFDDKDATVKHKVNFGWGSENKYCLKANYVDASHARNIIGARLSAAVVSTRRDLDENIANAPNYGFIDGFPILVYINGTFHGLYTLNIPKDEWQFAMKGDENTKEAILMAASWNDSVRLFTPIGQSFGASGWEVEYSSTTDQTWIKDSFNELIELLNCGNAARIKKELPKHLDIGAAIDNLILTYVLNAADNQAKNILWATYDGTKWIPSTYDMDATFGMFWDGTPVDEIHASSVCPYLDWDGSIHVPHSSQVFNVLLEYYPNEVKARWKELRADIITSENISGMFNEFFSLIDDEAYNAELIKWSKIPHPKENRKNMFKATEIQLKRLDNVFGR